MRVEETKSLQRFLRQAIPSLCELLHRRKRVSPQVLHIAEKAVRFSSSTDCPLRSRGLHAEDVGSCGSTVLRPLRARQQSPLQLPPINVARICLAFLQPHLCRFHLMCYLPSCEMPGSLESSRKRCRL